MSLQKKNPNSINFGFDLQNHGLKAQLLKIVIKASYLPIFNYQMSKNLAVNAYVFGHSIKNETLQPELTELSQKLTV